MSKLAKQKELRDWLHDNKVRTVSAKCSELGAALGTSVQYLGVMIRVTFGREPWRERFTIWFQDRFVNRGMPAV